MAQRRIIDARKKEKYMLDDEYLNGQARLCGWQATIVYNSLCRHANISQESFPSIKTMMEQHNVSRNTILKGIENLEKRNVIEVQKTRSKGGQWLNNTYILLDKSEWDYSQVPVKDMAHQVPVELTPSPCEGHGQVPVRDTKETHKQGNTLKETHSFCENEFSREEKSPSKINKQSEGVPLILEKFKKISPSISYGNKTQRQACQDMIDTFGIDDTLLMADKVIAVQGQKFAPRATTPHAMWTKIGDFRAFFSQNNQKIVKI